MRRRSVGILVAAAVLFLSASPVTAAVLTFNDGRVHSISTTAYEAVIVDYRSPGMGTTVNILEGSVINTFVGREDSTINMLGGWIRYLNAYDRSRVDISDGTIGDELEAYDSSKVNFSGGVIYNELYANGSSQITFSDGSVDYLWARDSSQVSVSGGSIGEFLGAKNNSQVIVSGGSMNGLWATHSSQVTVSAGSITNLGAWDSSRIAVSGGLTGGELTISENAVLTIDGSAFAVDGTDVGYGELMSVFGGNINSEPYRYLTGMLASGDLLAYEFRISDSASIVLIPEPATLLLLGLGGSALLRRRRQR